MTREDEELAQVFDPKVHTVEKLRQIMDEIFIESATLYCQKIRLVREMKKNGEFKGKESIEILLEKQQKEVKEAESDTYKEYKVTEQLVLQWMQKYHDDPYINQKFNKLKQIHQNVFTSEQGEGTMDHLPSAKLPVGMNETNYILIFRKQQQIFRHEVYKAVQDVERIRNSSEKESKLKEQYIAIIK